MHPNKPIKRKNNSWPSLRDYSQHIIFRLLGRYILRKHMRLLLIFTIFISTNLFAGVYKCTGNDGSVTFSQLPCEGKQEVLQETAVTHNSIMSEIESIEVFTAGYIKVQTISNPEKLKKIKKILSNKIAKKVKGYSREENIFIVKNGNKEQNWHIKSNGGLLLWPKNTNDVSKHYFLPNHEQLIELLNQI